MFFRERAAGSASASQRPAGLQYPYVRSCPFRYSQGTIVNWFHNLSRNLRACRADWTCQPKRPFAAVQRRLLRDGVDAAYAKE